MHYTMPIPSPGLVVLFLLVLSVWLVVAKAVDRLVERVLDRWVPVADECCCCGDAGHALAASGAARLSPRTATTDRYLALLGGIRNAAVDYFNEWPGPSKETVQELRQAVDRVMEYEEKIDT